MTAMAETRPQQWLAAYGSYADAIEKTLGPCRAIIESHPIDPLGTLINLCLQRSGALNEAVNRGDLGECELLFLGLKELNDELPEISTTRPPFSNELQEAAGTRLRSAGHSESEVAEILEVANTPERGAPRDERWTAIRALRLHNDGKSYPEIADALCSCAKNHSRMGLAHDKRLDPCSERYRNQIRRLSAILKKYSP